MKFLSKRDITPDQEIVEEIKRTVARLRYLSEEAKSRGITVYLKAEATLGAYVKPHNLKFDEAYRTNREEF